MKYRKKITLQYKYCAYNEAGQALAGVFDDIFSRIITVYSSNTYVNFSLSTVELFGFILDAKEKGIIPQFNLLSVN